MKKLCCFGLLLITAVWLIPIQVSAQHHRFDLSGPIRAEIIRVIDGDTIEVKAKIWIGQEITTRVRLRDIDTPELSGRCTQERIIAKQAKAYVQNQTQGPYVILTKISQGKYAGRVIADVGTFSGRNLGQQLLAVGLAIPYQKRRVQNWCALGRY